MNEPVYYELLETSWRRELTLEEKARLRAFLDAHPERAAEWPAEAALSASLRRLPDAPLPSNFTAQVMRAVALEEARRQRRSAAATWWHDWVKAFWPRWAGAGVALVLAVVAFQEYRAIHRMRLVRELEQMPVVAALPAPDVLEDFDAIEQFSKVRSLPDPRQTVSDEALLAALQ
jgi:anti-sigma factor RsiW